MTFKAITAETFLQAFFKPEETIHFRVFSDKKGSGFSGANLEAQGENLSEILDKLTEHNRQSRGVFFVVNAGGHKDADITRITAHFVERDGIAIEEQQRQVDAFALPPSIVVRTRKSLHVYWLMKEAAELSAFRRVQQKLIAYFNGDKACVNESRVLRVPGYYHCKEEPFPVECLKFEPTLKYTQSELQAVLPEARTHSSRLRQGFGDEIPDGERNTRLASYTGELLAKQIMTDAEALEAVWAINERRCRPPLSREEVENIVASIAQAEQRSTEESTAAEAAAEAEAKRLLEAALDKVQAEPGSEEARSGALAKIAAIVSAVAREVAVLQLAASLKPIGISRAAIRAEVEERRKKLGEAERPKKEASQNDIQYIADFRGLVDICENSETGEPCFLVVTEQTGELEELHEYTDQNGQQFLPPPRAQMPWLLASAEAVKQHYEADTDAVLFRDLQKHFEGVSELPSERYYPLLAWWTLHSYVYQKGVYSPYLWLYAVPERGKTRTGKALTYLAYRGVHVESLRDAYLVRITDNFGATLFFDCRDLWNKAEKQGTEDILLQRFERGAVVPRVIAPDKGAFRDTVYYSIYGATVVATNKQVAGVLETRAVQITMPASRKKFETDIVAENSLALKARLIAFRARHLFSDLPSAEKPTAGRLGDIMRPLLQTVRCVSPEEEHGFRELLAEIEDTRQLEKSSSQEAAILQAIYELEPAVNSGLLHIKTITAKYNEGVKERQQITPAGMGHKLKALGLKKKKTEQGMAIEWNEKLLEQLFITYSLKHIGIHTVESMQNLHDLHNFNNSNAPRAAGYKNGSHNLHAGEACPACVPAGYAGYKNGSHNLHAGEACPACVPAGPAGYACFPRYAGEAPEGENEEDEETEDLREVEF